MEGPVKERLTGALILIAVVVIVVPEMLSGPAPDHGGGEQSAADAGPPRRSYNLQLDTPAAASVPDQSTLTPQTAVAPAAATSAAATAPADAPPAATPAATASPAEHEAPPPVTEKPQAAHAPAAPAHAAAVAPAQAPAATPPSSSTPAQARGSAPAQGQWWLQLEAFSVRDNAERLARELRGAGYPVNVSRIRAGGKDLYRVRAGPAASREAAAGLQARLAAAGHKSSLVPP